MTYLTPVASFDPVPQLETSTLALAGPGGPMNQPLQALLNRTQYLHDNAAVGAAYQYPVTAGQTSLSLASIPAAFNLQAMFYNGVYQEPGAYTVTGTTMTFDPLPASGNIVVLAVFGQAALADASAVPYTPAGGPTRTVANKLGDFAVSVKDKGAKGDGTTNDSAAFQAAYDACPANGTIFVPAGTYPAPTVVGTKFVRWLCEGQPASGTIFNLPGIVEQIIATRKILSNKQTTAGDYGVFEARRETSHTGGTAGNVNAALRSYLNAGSGVTDYEWSFVSVLDNYAAAGQNVAVYGQGNKKQAGVGPTWAGVFEARDWSQTAGTAGGLVGVEIDMFANGADSNNNRVALDIVGGKGVAAGTKSEALAAIRVGPFNADSTQAKFYNGAIFGGDYTNVLNITGNSATAAFLLQGTHLTGLNTTGATLTGGVVRMARGQFIEFEATGVYTMSMDASLTVIRINNAGAEKIGFIAGASPGVRINGTQVIGARDTGWGAMTGTGSKSAIAAAAAGTASATYLQSDIQGALNRIAALEARLKAYDAMFVAHGLIGP